MFAEISKCLIYQLGIWHLKKHIFNLKQMKLTVCHVCRATSEPSTMKYECFCCSQLKPLFWYFTMYFSKPKNGTASFGDVFKTKNEGDVYHFLALYFKDDFWSVLLNFSAGLCSNFSYNILQTYVLGRSLWSQKILLTVLWTLEIMCSQWLRTPDSILSSLWCCQYFWYFEKPKLSCLSLRYTRVQD